MGVNCTKHNPVKKVRTDCTNIISTIRSISFVFRYCITRTAINTIANMGSSIARFNKMVSIKVLSGIKLPTPM